MGKPFDVMLAKGTDVTHSFQVWLYWPKLSIFTSKLSVFWDVFLSLGNAPSVHLAHNYILLKDVQKQLVFDDFCWTVASYMLKFQQAILGDSK